MLQKVDRSNIQFVTMPVEEPSWDPNRRIPSEPMARNVWNALKNDQALPVGTTYTDGNGAQLVVPDPTGNDDSFDVRPSDAGSDDRSRFEANPTDNTEQSASVANNAANEEAAKQTAATCPPKNQ